MLGAVYIANSPDAAQNTIPPRLELCCRPQAPSVGPERGEERGRGLLFLFCGGVEKCGNIFRGLLSSSTTAAAFRFANGSRSERQQQPQHNPSSLVLPSPNAIPRLVTPIIIFSKVHLSRIWKGQKRFQHFLASSPSFLSLPFLGDEISLCIS